MVTKSWFERTVHTGEFMSSYSNESPRYARGRTPTPLRLRYVLPGARSRMDIDYWLAATNTLAAQTSLAMALGKVL